MLSYLFSFVLIWIKLPINLFFYMALGFMIFMRGVDITWGIGRVLLKVEPVLSHVSARV